MVNITWQIITTMLCHMSVKCTSKDQQRKSNLNLVMLKSTAYDDKTVIIQQVANKDDYACTY